MTVRISRNRLWSKTNNKNITLVFWTLGVFSTTSAITPDMRGIGLNSTGPEEYKICKMKENIHLPYKFQLKKQNIYYYFSLIRMKGMLIISNFMSKQGCKNEGPFTQMKDQLYIIYNTELYLPEWKTHLGFEASWTSILLY